MSPGSPLASTPSSFTANAFASLHCDAAEPSATLSSHVAASDSVCAPRVTVFIFRTLWDSYAAADLMDTAIASCPIVRSPPPSAPVE